MTPAPPTEDATRFLKQSCSLLEVFPHPLYRPNRFLSLLALLSPRPRYVVATHSTSLAKRLHHHVATGWPEAIIAFEAGPGTGMSSYASEVQGIPLLMDDLQIAPIDDALRNAHDTRSRLYWRIRRKKTVLYLRTLTRLFDGSAAASAQERQRLIEAGCPPPFLAVIPNGVRLAHYKGHFGPREPDTLIFMGSVRFPPNNEGLAFFLEEIYPRILSRRNGVRLIVTGNTQGTRFDRWRSRSRVLFTGHLDDVRPTLARSQVSIVPIRSGGGTRLKVLESLAIGTPVVSTMKGAEGLDLVSGRDLLIADEPESFASAVLRLLEDEKLRSLLAEHGRTAVKSLYDWSMIGPRFTQWVEDTALASVRTRHRRWNAPWGSR